MGDGFEYAIRSCRSRVDRAASPAAPLWTISLDLELRGPACREVVIELKLRSSGGRYLRTVDDGREYPPVYRLERRIAFDEDGESGSGGLVFCCELGRVGRSGHPGEEPFSACVTLCRPGG